MSEISLAITNGKHIVLIGAIDVAKEFLTALSNLQIYIAESPSTPQRLCGNYFTEVLYSLSGSFNGQHASFHEARADESSY